MDSLWTPTNITSLDGMCYEVIDSSILQNIFSYLKMLIMQCRKNITVENDKKGMSIANFIYIYIYIYFKIINKTGKLIIQMGKEEQRNITSLTTSFANAFQVS